MRKLSSIFTDAGDNKHGIDEAFVKRILSGESLYALSKEKHCSYQFLRLIKQGKIYKDLIAKCGGPIEHTSSTPKPSEPVKGHSESAERHSEHKTPAAKQVTNVNLNTLSKALQKAIDKLNSKIATQLSVLNKHLQQALAEESKQYEGSIHAAARTQYKAIPAVLQQELSRLLKNTRVRLKYGSINPAYSCLV